MACCRLKLLLWRMLQLMPVLVLLLVEIVLPQDGVTPPINPGSPYISEKPKNKTVYKGERVSLTCKAQAYPQNVRYTWFKGDVDIMSTSAYPSRIDITRDGQLLIKPLIVSDHGWYRCRATNSMGSDEASAFLDVLFLPVIRQMQTEVTWAKGYNGQLDCPADANPPLNNVKWQKNVDELTSQGRFDILKNGTLLVSDVRQSDAGHYQCTPYNELGPGVQSPRIHVQVKDKPDPPFFVASPDVLYTRNVGDSVKIPCEATGLPRVNIQWIKVGGVLDRTSRRVSISNSFLEIRNLSKSDHGRYECRAINNIATVVKVTNLRIDKTTPHAPFNLTVTPGTFNVTVTWEPAHDGGTAQQYTLWFRRRNQISWNYMKVSPPSATHNRLYSLQPDTEYEFRVVSTNALGNSSFSETVRQRTLGFDPDTVNSLPTYANGTPYYPHVKQNIGIPPTPPRNLTARVRGKQIELRWDSPIHSPVQFFTFQIEYLRNMRWIRLDKVIEGEAARGAVFNIMGSGTYQLRLLSCGTLACSGGSNIVTVTVPDDDLVLSEALVGGIVGGILFLLVAILLALLAIFHSRKKDRKTKAKKYNDVTYGKPDELNGRYHERSTQWDRWSQHHGGGDIVTSLSNTDSIFFTPKSRDIHNREQLEQLQHQQIHCHPHHHHEQQQHLERDNPHFYLYSQQQQQQRPKFVVSHGTSEDDRGAGDAAADFAGAGGRNRKREPPDKNFHTGQDVWGDQHRPQGLVPFTEERRSKKKKKKNKKHEHEHEHELPPGTHAAPNSGGEHFYPAGNRNTNRHESSFRSDVSQAGSFGSRPLTNEVHDSTAIGENNSLVLKDKNGSSVLGGSVSGTSYRDTFDDQKIAPRSSHFPLLRYPMTGGRAAESDLLQGNVPSGYEGKFQHSSSHIPPYGQLPSRQYNDNLLNDSREEKILPQPQMSLPSSSLLSGPPHHTSSEDPTKPQLSRLSQNQYHQQSFPQPSLHSASGHINNNYRPFGTDSRHARLSHNFPNSLNDARMRSDQNRGQGSDLHDDTEDNVFWNPPTNSNNLRRDHPGLPRHSSLKPGHKMTYLTDDGDFMQPGPNDDSNRFPQPPSLFGLQDISSVLEPESEQPSQVAGRNLESPSPSHHGFSRSSNISGASTARLRPLTAEESYRSPGNTTMKPLAMVTPQSAGDNSNTSTMSSGRPLGYTRDRLQGVLQRLREGPHTRSRSEERPHYPRSPQDQQPRSKSEGGPQMSRPQYLDQTAQSDPFPQSRYNPHSYDRGHTTHSHISHVPSPDHFAAYDPKGFQSGHKHQPVVMASLPAEKNVYVNLQKMAGLDRERHSLMNSDGFPLGRSYPYQNEEANPYRNLPQPPLICSLKQNLHHGEEETGRRPRALSEGSRQFRDRLADIGDQGEDGGINKGASYPDVSLPRPVRASKSGYDPNSSISSQHFRPWYPAEDGFQQQHHNPSLSQSLLRHQSGLEPEPSMLVQPDWEHRTSEQGHQIPLRYSDAQVQPRLGYQSSSSSGIGSRNTSQSTGSLQHSHPFLPPHASYVGETSGPARHGTRGRVAGRGGTSLSSGHTDDGDVSLDTSSGGGNTSRFRGDQGGRSLSHQSGQPRHRRDTSVDENYEFDSINALENDIMDDLRRYSRLAGGGRGATTVPGSHVPSNSHSTQKVTHQHPLSVSVELRDGSMYPAPLQQKYPTPNHHQHTQQPLPPSNLTLDRPDNAEQRFERLREEFKAYRSQRSHGQPYGGTGSEDDSVDGLIHPPTAGSALPIGVDGEPLYPMDSEML